MINFVGKGSSSSPQIFYNVSTFEDFVDWEKNLLLWQLDCETQVCNSIVERSLKLIQFGDVDGTTQWVIDPRTLTKNQAQQLLGILNNTLKLKLIHNASFEYQCIKKYGICLENVYDTMLVEKILWCGYSTLPGFYSLKEVTARYLYKDRNKELQTSFDCEVFTPEQIQYAADDVIDMGHIMRLQKTQLKLANLEYVAALENEAVLGLAEIEYHGMRLDTDKWRENVSLAEPIIIEANRQLEEFVRSEEFKDKCIELGFLTDKESLTINWNSPSDKKKVLELLYPHLNGATKAVVLKHIKSQLKNQPLSLPDKIELEELQAYVDKDYDRVSQRLYINHRDWLVEHNLIEEADKVLINWQSPPQRLKVFKIVEPHLKSTDKQELADCDHPIIEAYQEYINSTKLKTSFGEAFIEKHVDSDGRVRTRFNQILNTGRVSSSSPNLQNIPAKESVGNRYRNAFIADEGWQFVDSDYKSMELITIAYFSKDKVWLAALAKDQDLHSVCAEQVFKSKWKDSAEEGCAYYQVKDDGTFLKDKCKCKKHKTLRTLVKTISFGLAFGMSKFKLSAVAKIPLDEAQIVIDEYFKAFPGISGLLNAFGRFGVNHGFIMTAKPFNRRRYYDYWEKYRNNDYWMGKIERASKNLPIQGSASDIAKLAVILIDRYIKDNKLTNKVKLVAQVHDQITTNVVKEFADEWLLIMDKLMCDAANFVIPGDLLGADTCNTGIMWSK